MAITNATRVADFGSGIGTQGAVLQVDNTNNRLGVGTTNPQAMLQVGTAVSVYGNSGIVSATSFFGDGANITGIANTDFINATQLNVIGVATASSFVGDGSNLTNVGVTTEIVNAVQLKVSGVTTSSSVIVGSAVTINSTGIDAVSGVITASSFVGNVTGNASGTAGGLSGSPSINVTNITASGTLTYEDVTNVDSIGIVTARGGLEVGAAGVGGTISSGGNVIFAGITTVGTALSLADNIKASFGNSNDLQIYHDASNAFIANNGSGDFYIQGGNVKIRNVAGSANLAQFVQSGKVGLFFNGSEKFETHNTGVNVTGIATISSDLNVAGITTVGILTAYESITVKVGAGSTELTTALSAKASTGKAIAMAMVFG